MKASRVVLAFALAAVLTATTRANLIVNGDFSAGNTGFSSGYTFVPNNVANGATGVYSVGTSSVNVNSFWSNPTTVVPNNNTYSALPVPGTSNFLFANGSTTASTPVWSETISLVNGTTYAFSGYLATLFALNTSSLTITAGASTILTTNAPSTTGVWNGFQNTFTYSGATGPVLLSITDTNIQGSGNDFALASLALNQVVPEPASVALFGAGLLGFGLAGVRRFRRRPAA